MIGTCESPVNPVLRLCYIPSSTFHCPPTNQHNEGDSVSSVYALMRAIRASSRKDPIASVNGLRASGGSQKCNWKLFGSLCVHLLSVC